MAKELPKRVSIQYTVDFSEVPERVQILLHELAGHFNSLSQISQNISAGLKENFTDSLKDLEILSQRISKSKERVDDCLHILVGYAEILTAFIEDKNAAEKVAEKAPAKKKTSKKKATTKKKKEEG